MFLPISVSPYIMDFFNDLQYFLETFSRFYGKVFIQFIPSLKFLFQLNETPRGK